MRQFFSFIRLHETPIFHGFLNEHMLFCRFSQKNNPPQVCGEMFLSTSVEFGDCSMDFPQEKPGVCGVPQGLLGMAPGSPRGCTGRANGRGLGTARVDGEWPLDDQMGGMWGLFFCRLCGGNHTGKSWDNPP